MHLRFVCSHIASLVLLVKHFPDAWRSSTTCRSQRCPAWTPSTPGAEIWSWESLMSSRSTFRGSLSSAEQSPRGSLTLNDPGLAGCEKCLPKQPASSSMVRRHTVARFREQAIANNCASLSGYRIRHRLYACCWNAGNGAHNACFWFHLSNRSCLWHRYRLCHYCLRAHFWWPLQPCHHYCPGRLARLSLEKGPPLYICTGKAH